MAGVVVGAFPRVPYDPVGILILPLCLRAKETGNITRLTFLWTYNEGGLGVGRAVSTPLGVPCEGLGQD